MIKRAPINNRRYGDAHLLAPPLGELSPPLATVTERACAVWQTLSAPV